MSSVTTDERRAASALLAYALDHRKRPGRHEPYEQLLERWLSDPRFTEQVAATAEGLGLIVLAGDPVVGLVVSSQPDSVFAPAPSRIRDTITGGASSADRLRAGVILAAIAAYCYPTAASLHDPALRQVTAQAVDTMLRTHLQMLADQDAMLEGELHPAWEAYAALKPVELTETGRWKRRCALGMVDRALQLLASHAMLVTNTTEPGVYRSTDRFRHHVARHGGTLAYRAVIDSPANPTEQETV